MLTRRVIVTIAIGLTTLASAQFTPPSTPGQACGGDNPDCSPDTLCIPDIEGCTDINDCGRICVFRNSYSSCGGHAPEPNTCDDSTECQDDHRSANKCGMACDLSGICVPKTAPSCAGFAGTQCPEGLFCYDVVGDGCDPNNGGFDCIGICL